MFCRAASYASQSALSGSEGMVTFLAAVESRERSVYHFVHVHQYALRQVVMSVPAFSQIAVRVAPGSAT
jgi:hypothetical protein